MPQLPVSQGSAQKGVGETLSFGVILSPIHSWSWPGCLWKGEGLLGRRGRWHDGQLQRFLCFLPRSDGHKSPSPAHRSLRATPEPPIALPLPGEPEVGQLFQDHPGGLAKGTDLWRDPGTPCWHQSLFLGLMASLLCFLPLGCFRKQKINLCRAEPRRPVGTALLAWSSPGSSAGEAGGLSSIPRKPLGPLGWQGQREAEAAWPSLSPWQPLNCCGPLGSTGGFSGQPPSWLLPHHGRARGPPRS